MSEQNFAAYIGRYPCGCIACASVDDGRHQSVVFDYCASWARKGLKVERTEDGIGLRKDPRFMVLHNAGEPCPVTGSPWEPVRAFVVDRYGLATRRSAPREPGDRIVMARSAREAEAKEGKP